MRAPGTRGDEMQRRAVRRITAIKKTTSDGGCARAAFRALGAPKSSPKSTLPLRARGETRTRENERRETARRPCCARPARAERGAKARGTDNHREQEEDERRRLRAPREGPFSPRRGPAAALHARRDEDERGRATTRRWRERSLAVARGAEKRRMRGEGKRRRRRERRSPPGVHRPRAQSPAKCRVRRDVRQDETRRGGAEARPSAAARGAEKGRV